jgi:hypothetical protein
VKNLIRKILKESVKYNYFSKSGNRVTTYFETGQGSKYVRTDSGETKRWKSHHTNTGGEDMGLKDWHQNSIFIDPIYEKEANAYQFMVNHVSKPTTIVVDKVRGMAGFFIYDNGSWRPATWSDAYPTAVKTFMSDKSDKKLVFPYIDVPKIGYNILEWDIKNGQIKSLHFGSPVSKVEDIDSMDSKDLDVFKDSN